MDIGLAITAVAGLFGSAHVAHGFVKHYLGPKAADESDGLWDDLMATVEDAVHTNVHDAIMAHGYTIAEHAANMVLDEVHDAVPAKA